MLRVAQGDLAAARSLIDEAVAHPVPLPWKERPPIGELQMVTVLEAQAQIAALAGNVDTCRAAADRLTDIARTYPGAGLSARADVACARALLLEGDVAGAASRAADAVVTWAEAGAPFDAAEARLVVAEAYELAGSPTQAMLERKAALNAFVAFGAAGRAAVVARLVGVPPAGPAVFKRKGDRRIVEFAGLRVVIPDLVGLRYIEHLISVPGRDLHEVDLAFSPVSNTLPIRRLRLEIVDSVDIVTAYVTVPDLKVTADPQRYTRLSHNEYLYESLDSDFSRVVSVDDFGLVVNYPGLFERRGSAPSALRTLPPISGSSDASVGG